MAAALLAAQLPGREIRSAGVGALIGYPADPLAVELMAEHGMDITEHRAQQASLSLLTPMDLILTLDQGHSDWLNHQYPQLRGRVHKLLRWRNNADVADPYRQPRAAFERAYREISAGVEDWLVKLR